MVPAGAFPSLRFIDLERAALEVGAVEPLHGPSGVGIRHFNEAEATRAPRVAVSNEGYFLDGSMFGEQGAHGFIRRREWKISNE